MKKSSSKTKKEVHLLVFPYPAQGHMLPTLDFTHQLLLRGITITILVTPANLHIINLLLSSHPSSIKTLIFPFPSHPSLPPGVENVKDVGNSGNLPIIAALSKLRDPILDWFDSHPNPPVAIVSDFFLGWTQHMARQIGIPRIVINCGAFLTSVLDYLWPNLESFLSADAVDFLDLPRSPSFRAEHLPSICRRYRKSDPDSELVRDSMIANKSSWASVFNSFRDLEGDYLEHLKKTMGHGRVFGVGPLSLLGMPDVVNRGGSGDRSSVLGWLDGCTDGSVLHVSFGSQKMLKKAQMEALASGLEKSGVPFVWVVKPATAQQAEDGYGSIPEEFEERVSGRGVVVRGWAPQVALLGHRAVGAFLSHCGWNSVLEAMAAGVTVLAWPMEADQFVNAKLLVEHMGAGLLVCEGADSVPDTDELVRKIGESMGEDTGVKRRMIRLKESADAAVSVGGSSLLDLDTLVEELFKL